MPVLRDLLAVYALPLGMAVAAVAVWLLGAAVADGLRYQSDAIQGGEWWRLLTGHWVHSGWRHLAVNLAGLVLVWHLFGQAVRPLAWLGLLVTIALGQSLSLLVFHPDILWYAGLSGLLHGGLVAGALLMLRRTPLVAGLALVALAVKLGLEVWQGPSADMAIWLGGQVLIESHLYGTAWGVGGAFMLWLLGATSQE